MRFTTMFTAQMRWVKSFAGAGGILRKALKSHGSTQTVGRPWLFKAHAQVVYCEIVGGK